MVDLFPPWFDFAADKFAILGTRRQVRLIFCNPGQFRSPDHALISTSDSRQMRCSVSLRDRVEHGFMDMHYTPSPEHRERARSTIALALRALYPERGDPIPPGVAGPIADGRVYPSPDPR